MDLLEKYCTERENYWFDIEHIFASDTTPPSYFDIHVWNIYIYIYIRIYSTFMICYAITILAKSNIRGKSYILAFDKSGNLINYF